MVGKSSDVKKKELTEKAKKVLLDAEKQGILNYRIPAEADKTAKSNESIKPSGLSASIPLSYSDDQYDYTYNKIGSFKKAYLSGKLYKGVRDELNLYLKRGRKTKADSRQATVERDKEAYGIILQWFLDFNGTQIFDLKRRFMKLNNPRIASFFDEEEK